MNYSVSKIFSTFILAEAGVSLNYSANPGARKFERLINAISMQIKMRFGAWISH